MYSQMVAALTLVSIPPHGEGARGEGFEVGGGGDAEEKVLHAALLAKEARLRALQG